MSKQLWAACPFCNIINGHASATILEEWDDALAIEPLNPVVHGHVLVIPKRHVRDYLEDSGVTAAAMRRAAEFGNRPTNIITSAGREATQTVQHLHLHIVPRAENDGLALPWTGQESRS
jgi:histidine triad (HIT) family protein